MPPTANLPSALDNRTQIFPILTPDQIDRIRTCGQVRKVSRGETLFSPHETNVPLFVLLSGGMEIVQNALDGERQVATHEPGSFTGEMTMITGQRCLVTGRVTEGGEFLEVKSDGLRTLIGRDAELSEIFLRAFILRRLALIANGYGNLILLGSRHSARTLELREFLSRNGHPYNYVDLDTDRISQELLDRFQVKLTDVPVVVCSGRNVFRSPSVQHLANCLGLSGDLDDKQVHDVAIVGAGPAGLAAAVYAASEGLDAVVMEARAPGGQAASSSKIENYLGFPTGISGQELATRASTQAQKFGAHIAIARNVASLKCDRQPYELLLEDGGSLRARTVVIASGARYNKLQVANLDQYEGNGVYYGATYVEAQLCESDDVAVVGGGNSAGQAAVYLSGIARKVHLLVRGSELKSTMSRYLIQRLTENERIELHYNTEVVALQGEGALQSMTWMDKSVNQTSVHAIQHLFLMTGASPCTAWLQGCLAMDDKGFLLTGRDLDPVSKDGTLETTKAYIPQMLETSLPGVFAVGDVRAGNVKRVASAVGEGSIAIHMVHRALARL